MLCFTFLVAVVINIVHWDVRANPDLFTCTMCWSVNCFFVTLSVGLFRKKNDLLWVGSMGCVPQSKTVLLWISERLK